MNNGGKERQSNNSGSERFSGPNYGYTASEAQLKLLKFEIESSPKAQEMLRLLLDGNLGQKGERGLRGFRGKPGKGTVEAIKAAKQANDTKKNSEIFADKSASSAVASEESANRSESAALRSEEAAKKATNPGLSEEELKFALSILELEGRLDATKAEQEDFEKKVGLLLNNLIENHPDFFSNKITKEDTLKGGENMVEKIQINPANLGPEGDPKPLDFSKADTTTKKAEKAPRKGLSTKTKALLTAGVLILGTTGLVWAADQLSDNNEHRTQTITTTIATPTTTEAAGTPTTTKTTEAIKTTEVGGLWAQNANEAAYEFGSDDYSRNPANWELSAEGGWRMKEDGSQHILNLRGFVGQGYWDTLPGKDAQAVVANGGTMDVLGGTIWNVQGVKAAQVLYNQMGINSWSDGTLHEPLAIGFTPDKNAGFTQ